MTFVVTFLAWLAGLWWLMLIGMFTCAGAVGPLIMMTYEDVEDDRDRPLVYGTLRLLLLGFSWSVVGLILSLIGLILHAFP